MSSALEHSVGVILAEREKNEWFGLQTAADLWDFLEQRRYEEWWGDGFSTGSDMVVRGQSNSDHGLTSSLVREAKRVLQKDDLEERDLAGAEERVLWEARQQGIGRLLSDGHLLALLQHHGVPTRMIDVSLTPFEGLYFAVNANEDMAGRIFFIRVHSTEPTEFRNDDLPWARVSHGSYADQDWTNSVSVADPGLIDARMIAQRGRFLVGGLPRNYPGVESFHAQDGTRLPYSAVASMAIKFAIQRRKPSDWYGATAITVRVEAAWKRDLAERLRDLAPSHGGPLGDDQVYPPIQESVRLLRARIRE